MTNVTDPERKTKPLSELERNDWIHADFEDFIDVAQVVHVETYPSDSWGIGAILLYRAVGETDVHVTRFAADDPMRMLTDDEIGQVLEDERREEIARRLVSLANLVRSRQVALPANRITVNCPFGEDVAAVEAVAELVGEQVITYGRTSSVIQEGSHDFGPTVVVDWSARRPDEPVPAVPNYGRGDEARPGEVADEPLVEHVEASATGHSDGTYDAECACGTTVEGFDSFDEARAELAVHIADATKASPEEQEREAVGYVPQMAEPGYPGCPGCGHTVNHAAGCREDES